MTFLPIQSCPNCGDDVVCQRSFDAGVQEGLRRAAKALLEGAEQRPYNSGVFGILDAAERKTE